MKKKKKPSRKKMKPRHHRELLAEQVATLTETVSKLIERLEVAEAQIHNLLQQKPVGQKHTWPNWPYVNPWSPTWSPDWPAYYEVRTEVKRDPAV
jgi:hypothetical protein